MIQPSLRVLLGALLIAAGGGGVACQTDPEFRGESMGRFQFQAGEFQRSCPFQEIPSDGGFAFEGQLSREPGATGLDQTAYFTLNGISREGTFNGQVFEGTAIAPRRFELVNCTSEFQVEETLRIAVLSESQSRALGDRCPEDTLSLLQPGGVPLDPDAGIVAPSAPAQQEFDAIRACGVLVEVISPQGGCDAIDGGGQGETPDAGASCLLIYRVEGVRKQ